MFDTDPDPATLERPPTEAEKIARAANIPRLHVWLPWYWRRIARYINKPVPLDPRTNPLCHKIIEATPDGQVRTVYERE